jgi:solute carrier family 35, member E4
VPGTITNGCLLSTTGKLMSEKVDAMRLTFYMSPLVVLLLTPFFFMAEATNMMQFIRTHDIRIVGEATL